MKVRLHVRQVVLWVSKCSRNPAYVGNRAPQDAHPCTFMTVSYNERPARMLCHIYVATGAVPSGKVNAFFSEFTCRCRVRDLHTWVSKDVSERETVYVND